MNPLENLQNKIPDFSIDYTGVRCDMSDTSSINEALKSKKGNIFVKNSMKSSELQGNSENDDFIKKYAESSMNPSKQQGNSKNDDFGESNITSFLQIVQGKEPIDIKSKIKKEYLGKFIESTAFNRLITIIILINTIFICIQTNDDIYQKMPVAFQVVDALCVIIFTIEIALKLIADPKEFIYSGWNIFDLIIVIFSYVSSSLTFITSFRVLRIFRVLKAFRIIKGLKSANIMSRMFQALIKASKDIGFVLFLIIMFLLCASFIALNLFSSFSDYWFGSFTKTLWTLVIFLTADGWLDPYLDLVDAGQRYMAMGFIFVFIWIGAWILINTLVGVSINSINSANKEFEEENELKVKNGNKKDDKSEESEVKKLAPPPFNYDRSWEAQIPLEIPRLDHINPDALIHLYLTLSLINQNINEMDDLIGQYQQTVSTIISQQDDIQRND